MELKPQIIKKDDKNEYVVLTYKDYLKIQQALEDYQDLIDLRKAKAETINEPSIPFSDVKDEIKKQDKKE
ncbi:MAG: type II toxin-antitoxin system Phd/YefM family antitoxin [Ignavibacteria bacterium]|nr:type II toxin-antitoxin system Phd/YefM family antitoxin [Ignavibacteria bacterium]